MSPMIRLFSIADCEVCTKIHQRHEKTEKTYGSTEVHGFLPEEMRELVDLEPNFKKCPYCGTYYNYVSFYDPGEVSEASTDQTTLERITPTQVEHLLLREKIEEEQKKSLLDEIKNDYDESNELSPAEFYIRN